jgi:hypothetical protein
MNNKYLLGLAGLVLGLLMAVFFVGGKQDTNIGYSNQYDGFVVSKDIISSAISTTTATDLTQPVTGKLLVDNIVLSTNATGLAGCTTFTIMVNGNTYGTTTIASHAVSGLGANQTVDLNSATGKQRIVLENGAKLQFKGVSGTCSGAGVIRATVFLKKAESNSIIAD